MHIVQQLIKKREEEKKDEEMISKTYPREKPEGILPGSPTV